MVAVLTVWYGDLVEGCWISRCSGDEFSQCGWFLGGHYCKLQNISLMGIFGIFPLGCCKKKVTWVSFLDERLCFPWLGMFDQDNHSFVGGPFVVLGSEDVASSSNVILVSHVAAPHLDSHSSTSTGNDSSPFSHSVFCLWSIFCCGCSLPTFT